MPRESKNKRIAVVMAGGSGERFWPLSRQLRPKQLLRLTGSGMTMIEESVARLTPLIPPGNIYVATSRILVKPIRDAKPGVPDENIIAEPCKRNTAGCLAYATAHILAKENIGADDDSFGNLSMAVVTADQSIGDAEEFRATVSAALDAAEREKALAVIGIVPSRAETGYGYVETPDDGRPLDGFTEGIPVYRVGGFHEKPDGERARHFVASGRYLWNAGMFFWRIADFMRELDTAYPALSGAVRCMTQAMRSGDKSEVARVFEQLDNISIDIALMERARNVLVARASFPWDDVGAWPALERTHTPDANRNIAAGDAILIDSRDCIVYNDCDSPSDRVVSLVGVEGLVVVATHDAVLVMPKERAQDVREVVSELKRRGAPQI